MIMDQEVHGPNLTVDKTSIICNSGEKCYVSAENQPNPPKVPTLLAQNHSVQEHLMKPYPETKNVRHLCHEKKLIGKSVSIHVSLPNTSLTLRLSFF